MHFKNIIFIQIKVTIVEFAKMLLIFLAISFSWLCIVLKVMTFLITVIANHSENVFSKPGYCINVDSKGIKNNYFLVLIMIKPIYFVFDILIIGSFDKVLRAQEVI